MRKWIFLIVILAVIAAGCRRYFDSNRAMKDLPDPKKAEVIKSIESTRQKIEYIYKNNWLIGVFAIAMFCGVMAAFNGRPMVGLGVIAGAVAGGGFIVLFQILASHPVWAVVISAVVTGLGAWAFWSSLDKEKGFAVKNHKEN